MKKNLHSALYFLIICGMLLICPGCRTDAPPVSLPLCLADVVINRLAILSSKQEFIDVFGEPANIEGKMTGMGYKQYFVYPFGDVVFEEREGVWVWTGITTDDASLAGPRGVRVGDTLEDVFKVFPHEAVSADGKSVIFYRFNKNSERHIAVPPSGEMLLENGEPYELQYDFPLNEDWYREPWVTDMESDYVYTSHVLLKLSLIDGIISRITIYTGPYAE